MKISYTAESHLTAGLKENKMIKTGICSVTLGNLTVEQVLEVVSCTELEGIEWWGSGHVPHGKTSTAERVRDLTLNSGFELSSYGSYYRVGVSEFEGLSFSSVLDTADALGAPTIRVWAGDRNYNQADKSFIQSVMDDSNRIADLAAAKDISITFEYHGGTLTDRNHTARMFAEQIGHPNIFFSWQPPHGYSLEHCLAGLRGLLERLSTIHVYHWTIGSYEKNTLNETVRPLKYPDDFFRHPLSDGIDRWEQYFAEVALTGRDHYALLEFVKDDCPENVLKDAATLNRLVSLD
jgi:3-dehydroshikimate dehydratase